MESFEHLHLDSMNSDSQSQEEDCIEPYKQDYYDAVHRDPDFVKSSYQRGRVTERKLNFDDQGGAAMIDSYGGSRSTKNQRVNPTAPIEGQANWNNYMSRFTTLANKSVKDNGMKRR